MPSHHQRLHRRSVGEKWDDIKRDIQNIANDLTNKSPDQAQHEIRAPAPSTVFKTVYKTMDPTFTGAIGGYVTMNSAAEGSPTVAVAPAPTSDGRFKAQATQATLAVGAGVLPESLVPSSGGDFSDHTSLAVETAPTTARNQASSTLEPSVNAVATPAASSSAAPESSSEGGGAAAKAGIAIGVLAGLLIIGLAVFFLFSRRRKQMEKERAAEAEKSSPPFGGAAAVAHARQPSVLSTHTTRTTATAPRLSLRPVTQFLPEFSERRSSKGAAMALALGPAPSNSQVNCPAAQSPWERPMTSQSNSQDNPFGDHAEHYDGAPRSATMEQPYNPFDAPEHVVGVAQTTDAPRHAPNGMAAAAAAAAAAVGGAAAGAALTRKQSVRKDVPQPLDLTRTNEAPLPLPSLVSQPSPTGTEFSFTSVAPGQSPGPSQSANAIAAAGGPAHSTVHRVQLDFKPSLEDEMELKAGQLVRLLHEYDDGWALCIRLDRSQQGVVPRTCLSTRPVKPRPAGGPPGARNGPPIIPNRGPVGPPRGQRPMTPQGGRPQSPAMMSRPQSPAMMRPQSPAMRGPQSPAGMRGPQSPGGPMNGRPVSPGPRPMSPADARGQSPGPRQRGNSESGQKSARRMTPPGPVPCSNSNSHQGLLAGNRCPARLTSV
ncbi:variant SH3 domain-containing protein [Apiospora phragmitis]|uniref:Variant SH3 domain-containing protein n=1 Tax=Apiospora phragmitis TaxID=2905665 RepID=A0ABR1T741_9PEZI